MHQYLNYWDKLVLILRINWCISLILVGKIAQTLEEVQDHALYFIKVGQLTMAHMFQYQFLNKMHKVGTMEHALQECIQHTSGC